MMVLGQPLDEAGHLGALQVCTSAQVRALPLDEGVRLLHGARACLHKHLFRGGDRVQLGSATCGGSIVVCRQFHAIGLRCRPRCLCVLEQRRGRCKIRGGSRFRLLRVRLERLLLFQLLRVVGNLVFQALFQQGVVVLSARLLLAQGGELLLGLCLKILQDVQDPCAVRFVGCWVRGTRLVRLSGIPLLLRKRNEPILVGTPEGNSVHNCAESSDQTGHARDIHLHEGGGVLGHFLGDQVDRPRQGAQSVRELCLAG
mmetsp:Transcript_54392/g.151813  ORF Transcript_54392/g.151813 Transcript_54392/m.151813 type:complete len:257 (+) Transcript_54392:941-1711(+)